MPSTASDSQNHSDWEEESPYDNLEEDMDPEDRVYRGIYFFFGQVIVVFVCESQTSQGQ